MNHNTVNPNGHDTPVGDATSTSRRVADALHERLDQAAEKGERLERKLHEKGEHVQDKSRELNGSLTRLMNDRPWAVVGGAVALGLLLGALTRR